MTQKPEWELVDEPASQQRTNSFRLLFLLFGRHWKWKVLGGALFACLAFIIFAMVSSVVILAGAIIAVLTFTVTSLIGWFQQKNGNLRKAQGNIVVIKSRNPWDVK